MTTSTRTPITSTELQRAEQHAAAEGRVEVVDGALTESPRDVTLLHMAIIQNLFVLLRAHVKARQLGSLFINGARFILHADADGITSARMPDLAFVRAERVPADLDWTGDFPGVPDFVLEVASPGPSSALLLGKLADYFRHGCEEAWLIYPWREQLFQYRRDEAAPNIYGPDEPVDTSALFPGLNITLRVLMDTERI